MENYISLLRGINVGGRNKIKMADLRKLYEQLGHEDVETYIQSGNVIFKSKQSDVTLLENQIKEQILADYGYHISIIIKKADLIKTVIESNPYLQGRNEEIKLLCVTFLSGIPNPELVNQIKDFKYKEDEFIIQNDHVFLFTPGGYGKTKLSNNFFEKKLKVSATTRNWKTVLKLQEMVNLLL